MTIKDSDGAEWSVDMDYVKLVDLARSIPLFVNQLAQHHAKPRAISAMIFYRVATESRFQRGQDRPLHASEPPAHDPLCCT
jgi:hypothetical protein